MLLSYCRSTSLHLLVVDSLELDFELEGGIWWDEARKPAGTVGI